MRISGFIFLLALGFSLLIVIAHAQPTANSKLCLQDNNTSPDVRIGACTALIQSGKEPKNVIVAALLVRGSLYSDKSDFEHAIQDLDEAVRLDPLNAQTYFGRAQMFFDKTVNGGTSEDTYQAIANYREAIRLQPPPSVLAIMAYHNREHVYHDEPLAIADYSVEISLYPQSFLPWQYRGSAFIETGEYARAVVDLTQAIKLAPGEDWSYLRRATAHQKGREYDEAIKDYTVGLKVADKNKNTTPAYLAQFYRGRGDSYDAVGDVANALADYDRAIRLEPDNADGWNERCWARARQGQLRDALTDCNQAIQLKPDYALALDSRGLVYLKMGDFDKSIGDYDAAIKAMPRLASSLYGRGVAKNKKLPGNGQSDIAAAIAISPNIERDYANYGIK
jgi:tetratricopeptide (TPR) repeat protein